MNAHTFIRSVTFACLFFVAGCTAPASVEPKYIDDIRPVPPAIKTTSFSIQRKDFIEALSRSRENTVRLVPVYATVATTASYEYRVFDIRPSSAYSLLGLENSDILIAVNRYLIKRPPQFATFVQLLASEDEATIEIRRGGESKLLKYRFLPSVKAAPKP